MEDTNHWHGTGTIVEDATLKELSNRKLVSNFYLKIRELVTTHSGSTIILNNIVRVVGWNELATHAAKHAKSGDRVSIEGRLHVAKWVGKDGTKNVAYEIHLVAPIKPLQESREPLSPLTPDLYPPRAIDRWEKND